VTLLPPTALVRDGPHTPASGLLEHRCLLCGVSRTAPGAAWFNGRVVSRKIASPPNASGDQPDVGGVARTGDDGVAGEIVDLQPRLYRFARSLTADPEEASDLAQETTARALRALRTFTPGTNLRAWLFRILQNAYLNGRRAARMRRQPATVGLSPAGLESADGLRSVEHDVLVRAELRAVLAAFRGLPERYATPLYLSAVEEKSYAEVALELGVPVGTVMSRIHRARRMLLASLAEERS